MSDNEDKPVHGCSGCPSTVPPVYDIAVAADGARVHRALPSSETDSSTYSANASAYERRARFLREIDKCILCLLAGRHALGAIATRVYGQEDDKLAPGQC